MSSFSLSSQRLRRVGGRVAIGAGILASLAGVYAFRALSARPGEAALRYVPADAFVAASFDLTPSASQVLAFKRIDDALARNGYGGFVEKSLVDIFENGNQIADPLKPYVQRCGAVAVLSGPDGTMKDAKGLALLAVTDAPAVQTALDKNGLPQFYKGTKCYKLLHGRSFYMLEGETLLVGENPTALYRARQVIKGEAPSITADSHFVGARSHVADDANVMVFMSPKLVSSTGIKQADDMVADWMAMGLAIRDGGIGVSYSGLMNVSKMPELATMGKIPPISDDLFRRLPSGAYGAYMVSEPSAYFESVEGSLKDEDLRKGLADMEDQMQKETGMSFRKDVLPAFKGNFVAAVYPNGTGPATGLDGLLVLDDTNGADPANAVERFRDWVKRQIEKEGNQQGPLWTEREASGAHFYRIADKQEADLRKSLGEGMGKEMNKGALVDKKTITWAIVGHAVIAATSEDLLARAVQSYQNGADGLNQDAKFAAARTDMVEGSQHILVLSLSRIADGIRNTVSSNKMDKDGKQIFEGVLDAFATLDHPLTISGRAQADGRVSGGVFVPLDYDKMIDLAGKATKK